MQENKPINRIVHISAASPYMDEGSYQDTLFANAEIENYPSVTFVTTNIVFNPDGSREVCSPRSYRNSKGVQIIRFASHRTVTRSRGNVFGLYRILRELNPDFIMDHGFCPTSSLAVVLYKRRNQDCKVVADSHMTRDNYDDKSLGVRERTLNLIQYLIGKLYFKQCDKVYGITSQTVEMIEELWGVPKEKTEVLPLGYDDSKIDLDNQKHIRRSFREKHRISEAALVFSHGGKLVRNKRTLELVRAFKAFPEAKLIVFGNFADIEYENLVKKENSDNVIYMGYLNTEQIYELYLSSDAAAFPGKPSCLRQEAVACGLPIIFCQNEGDEDINILMNDNGIKMPIDWDQDTLEEAIKDLIGSFSDYREKAGYLARNDFRKYAYSVEAEYVLNN